MTARERILARLRAAAGTAAGAESGKVVAEHLRARPLSPRPRIDGDRVARFRECALKLSTTVDEVAQLRDVPAAVAAYLRGHKLPLRAVGWKALDALDWAGSGLQFEARAATADDAVGITEVFCAVAETGTLMTLSGADTPPATSLLPETHIAIVRIAQIVPAMEEAWQRLRDAHPHPPRTVNFISGPSRTADIEQTVTLGAHGPYRVHVVLVST